MGFHDPRCAPTPISPVSGITYLQGLGLRPWAQSVLSAAGAATSSASPAAPLAASRRIRAETSPCAPPGGGAPRHPACASPRHSLRARNGDQDAGGGGRRDAPRGPARRVGIGSQNLGGESLFFLFSPTQGPLCGPALKTTIISAQFSSLSAYYVPSAQEEIC